jgi:phosphoenolpyruvate---glycerone phosphotransferase subunit DhaL
MAGFTSADVQAAAVRAAAAMAELKDALNAADARIGDGDTGSMLARVLSAIGDKARDEPDQDVGALFTTLARTAASSTGSSLGTLLATALLSFGKATRGRDEVAWSSLGSLVAGAQAAMMARGGATLGDKTVLDGLHAVSAAIGGFDDPAAIGAHALRAAEEALNRFRDRPNRIGRARMFADASIGVDDPGMLAFARLIGAILARPSAAERVAADPGVH